MTVQILEPATTIPRNPKTTASGHRVLWRGTIKVFVSLRPAVIETAPRPWQGRVLPLNHGRAIVLILFKCMGIRRKMHMFLKPFNQRDWMLFKNTVECAR